MADKDTPYSYDVLGDESRGETTAEILKTVYGRRKNRTMGFQSMDDVRVNQVDLANIYLQNALGTYGLAHNSLIEIIGEEGLGKTSLVMSIAGKCMDAGCPVYYLRCESKQLQRSRILRCLSEDPVKARRMMKSMDMDTAKYLGELEEKINDWCDIQRGIKTAGKGKAVCVPMDTPIVVIADPWGKLLNRGEAAGRYDWGIDLNKAGAKVKGVGEASNLLHSKYAAAWARHLTWLLPERNVIVILVHHQNDNIDMSGGGMSYLPSATMKLYNKTKIGGKAFNQTAALQIILAKGKQSKVGTRVVGKFITARVDKNSMGPDGRKFSYEIVTEISPDDDTLEHQQPAISFDKPMADWMAENGLLNTTVNRGRFTCEELGVVSGTAHDLANALNASPKARDELGARLGIEGYDPIVDDIIEEIDKEKDGKKKGKRG